MQAREETEGPSAEALEEYAAANGLEVTPPARPELQPGESITTMPERYCERCDQPRNARKCNTCGALTVRVQSTEEAEEYEPPALVRRELLGPVSSRFDEEPEEYDDEYEEEEPARAVRVGGAPRQTQPRQQRTPAAFRGRRSQQERGQAMSRGARLVERDGEVVHMPVRRRHGRGAHLAASEELAQMWLQGQVKQELWYQGYAALLQGCRNEADVAMAAQLADVAYIEMMARQRSG